MFFCYEKNFANQWIPKIYHGEVPSSAVSGKEAMPQRTNPVIVPLKADESVRLAIQYMTEHFPPPEEESKDV
jgi:hypothetical protein